MNAKTFKYCKALFLSSILMVGSYSVGAETYDVVFQNARVIDPETKLDDIRNVGINGKKIAAVSKTPLEGKVQINAEGLILGPGFIDLHSHSMSAPSMWMQAYDGVTTTLELELGAFPVKKAYAHAATLKLPINYGYSASWGGARLAVADGVKDITTYSKAGPNISKLNWSKLLPPEKSDQVIELLEQELLDGGLGIGVVLGYAPKTNREEYVAVGKLAAKYDIPTYTHLRAKNANEPDGAVEGFLEPIAISAGTGARMHICHINSTALKKINDVVSLIEKAQNKKLYITTEAYPWGAGSTAIGAPFIRPANLPAVGIKSSDIYYAKNDERPETNERLSEIQKADPGGVAVIHYLNESKPDEMKYIDSAMLFNETMIASDAMPYMIDGRPIAEDAWPIPKEAYSHPRSAATFTVALARYVRDNKSMSMVDLFRRGSLLPANLVGLSSSSAKSKGRIQPGMDADIIVFDLNKVKPKATYKNPRLPSEGMKYVMVNGQMVINDGVLRRDVRAGEPIVGQVKSSSGVNGG